MQNLEQRRAAHALAHADNCRKQSGEGDCLSGYPGLIINNGLLACLAYSIEKKDQHLRIADAITSHLRDMEIFQPSQGGPINAPSLLQHLSDDATDALVLRRATDEALAFLGYLKRFSKSNPPEPAAS